MFRQFAIRYAVGPIAKIFERHAAKLSSDPVRHPFACLTGSDAARPCFLAGLELTKLCWDSARRFLPQLMAADTVDITHALPPKLARDILRDIGRTSEILLRWHVHHGIPVDRWIILRRRSLVWCRYRCQIELLARLGAYLRRVY